MGTHATVKFKENNQIICAIYFQYDGYMEGVGADLAKFLQNKTMINGIGDRNLSSNTANGMGCLAAQYVKDFKDEIGNLYMTSISDSQDYDYIVSHENNQFNILVKQYSKTIFQGNLTEFIQATKRA